MGKGSKQRPTDKKKFNANYDRIFGKKEEKCKKNTKSQSEPPQRIAAKDTSLSLGE